jgi:hypothetical protein
MTKMPVWLVSRPPAAPGVRRASVWLLAMSACGCSHAPAQDILGSFFPAWMLCTALGVLVAIVIRYALRLAGIGAYVPLPPLTYIFCAAAVTLFIWLSWFGG